MAYDDDDKDLIDSEHLDDYPDEMFEGYAPEHLSEKEWSIIRSMASKKMEQQRIDGEKQNYTKAVVDSYFDFLDIVTEFNNIVH